MTDVRAAFRDQADSCAALGSVLTARLCRLCADRMDDGAVAARVLAWPGDPAGRADATALRVMGGLHALVLSGADPALAAAYAEAADLSDDHLWSVVAAALDTHADHLCQWLETPPQTNEVRRSTVLIAAGHWLAARFGLPLVLSELGASAGLNLLWDHWALQAGGRHLGPADAPVVLTPDWQGKSPVVCPPKVIARAGVDMNPLHPVRDRLRLLSYIWADQPDRIARTRAALDRAALNPPDVAKGDAVDWLAGRLSTRHPGAVHLVFHTVAWQYFAPDTQARGAALLDAQGARATPDAPLARLAMEADATGEPGAAVTLDLWPEGRRIPLGRADFHGRWLKWTAPDR